MYGHAPQACQVFKGQNFHLITYLNSLLFRGNKTTTQLQKNRKALDITQKTFCKEMRQFFKRCSCTIGSDLIFDGINCINSYFAEN